MAAKRALIVGGGFGGLQAAKLLGKDGRLDVTLIDARNHHLFQPLLYQIAMAGLSPADIAVPIRSILAPYRNVRVVLGTVDKIDATTHSVFLKEDPASSSSPVSATNSTSAANSDTVNSTPLRYDYDFLLLACGARHAYFGRPDWEPLAPGLKTIEQATEIRRRVLFAFEQAEKAKTSDQKRAWQTFLIVGGGPTGVELAGSLAEMSRRTLGRDFRHIDPTQTRVILVEALPRILTSFEEDLSQRAARDLESLGVQIWTSTKVTELTQDGAQLGAEFVASKTILWAAGVQPSSLGAQLGTELDRTGRVVVTPELNVPAHPELFVIGDMSHCNDERGQPLPGLAPVAMQQGRHVARNILRLFEGHTAQPFHYVDKGQMATIGRSRAIVQVGSLRYAGWPAWMTWLFIHIYYLIGFRNRLIVFLDWMWSYATYKRGARLIVDKEWRFYGAPAKTGADGSEQKK